jgi:Protein of unknown function (DUF3667)
MTDEAGATHCLNCGVALTGPWCANCGQKHQPEIHTLGHFAGEAFENITHADSRLWRTLWILVSRPGLLTREFFGGRRMRYLPPVRFYLVVSLLFFLIAGVLGKRDNVVVNVNSEKLSTAESCDKWNYSGPYQDWVKKRLPAQCRKILADNGKSLASAFINNTPKALFVVLPLLAAIMTLLYWWPRHHYVEHLLLLLHNHTFLFCGYGLLMLLDMAFPGSATTGVVLFLFNAYVVWYFFRGMRTFYQQTRLLTLAKYTVMALVYLFVGGIALFVTVLFSAITL